MSTTRQDFVNSLQQFFTAHSKTYAECLRSSHELLKNNYTSRVFEDFPQLLPPKVMQDVKQKYKDILKNIQARLPDGDLELKELTKPEKKLLANLELHISYLAVSSILTIEGDVKPQLIALMKWQPYQQAIKPQNLVVGFVATVNHQVQLALNEEIDKKPIGNAVISNYIDGEKEQWADDAIKHLTNNPCYYHYIAASALGGLILSGLTALTVYGLYKQNLCFKDLSEKISEDFLSNFSPKKS